MGDSLADIVAEIWPVRGVTVRRGDTLWAIACTLYGDGTRWREIARKNGVTNPRKLQIGTVLTL